MPGCLAVMSCTWGVNTRSDGQETTNDADGEGNSSLDGDRGPSRLKRRRRRRGCHQSPPPAPTTATKLHVRAEGRRVGLPASPPRSVSV